MLKLVVFDLEFNILGMVEEYKLAQYTAEFNGTGSFQITCPAVGTDNVSLLKEDRVIWFEGTKAGIIQYVAKDRTNVTQIIVKGCMLNGFLEWRSVHPTYTITNTPEIVMHSVVAEFCSSNTDTRLNFPNFEYSSVSGFDDPSITWQNTGKSVADCLVDIGDSNGLGHEIQFLPMDKLYMFTILKGADRRVGNENGNTPVIFSVDLNNILSSDYTLNLQEYRNYVIIYGEGEGAERRNTRFFRNDEEVSGFHLRELYVDARDLQSTSTDDEGNETSMSDADYMAGLVQRGNEKFEDAKKVESYTAEIRNDALTLFTYGKDYFLGDTVTVIDKELEIRIDATVTSVTASETAEGYTLEPTFGYGQPSLYQKLKRKGVF